MANPTTGFNPGRTVNPNTYKTLRKLSDSDEELDQKSVNNRAFSSSPSEESVLSGSPNSSPTFSRLPKHHTLERQPVRLQNVKKHADSAPDLKTTHPRYNRSNSDMHFDRPRNFKTAPPFHEMHFSSIRKFFFNEAKAAAEFFEVYKKFPKNREILIQNLVETRKTLSSDKHLKRMDVVITKILKLRGSSILFWSYFNSLESPRDEIPRFANNAIRILLTEKDSSCLILQVIKRITRSEIKNEKLDTLFRETNFSSALCREYGVQLWTEDLNNLLNAVKQALDQSDLVAISLDQDVVSKTPGPETLDEKLDEHAKRFSEFARPIIQKLFELSPPKNLQQMLVSRRKQIIKFLRKHSLEKEEAIRASRTYISEILHLRLVNGKLLLIDLSPLPHNVLVSLGKVLQCLAKEAPFGFEKQEPIYERLNPLFSDFLELHREFIDRFSLPIPPQPDE